MDIKDNQDASWLAYRERMRELVGQACDAVAAANPDPFQAFYASAAWAYRDILSQKFSADDSTKFIAFHVLIASTVMDRSKAPLFDLPGDMSIEKFLTETIAGKGALDPEFQKNARKLAVPFRRNDGVYTAYEYDKHFVQTGQGFPPLAQKPEKPKGTGFGSKDLIIQVHFWGVGRYKGPA